MYREGYLIKYGHHTFDPPQIYFCVFEDGVVKFYMEKGGVLVDELEMAGHVTKVRVEKSLPSKLPYRFTVSAAVVVRVEGRRMKLGETRVTEFAAPTNDLMKEWANSLHLWRRMNWKENVKFFDNSSELSQAQELDLLQHQMRTVQAPSPTIKKLRQMIMHTGTTACSSTA
ncbi:unnamed protein product [Peronospora belbahrii]|uniref:PH domain-containing protein n=1 Tax=Peronospora belbahrii TaxID=622444 RepID=A0AAU9KPH0_9STRA|nr:unnamed protein product [Peronospora belbahrii]CAH0518659.1 unnamed protein product [Peronospora belbahrii]